MKIQIKNKSNLYFFGLISVFLLTLLTTHLNYIENDSIFYNMASGRNFINKFNPQEPFSYLVSKEAYYNFYLLGNIILYLFSCVIGIKGIWFVSFVTNLLLFVPLFKKNKAVTSKTLFCFLSFLLILINYKLWKINTDYFAWLLAFFYFLLLEKNFSTDKLNKKQWIPVYVIQILWVNSHPSFFLGPLIFFIFIAFENKNYKRYYKRFILLLLSCLASPHGIYILKGPYEWIFLYKEITLDYAFIYLLINFVFLIFYYFNKTSFNLPKFIVALLWFCISCFKLSWCIPGSFLLVYLNYNFFSQVINNKKGKLTCSILIPAIMASIFFPGYFEPDKFKTGINKEKYPVAAGKFLDKLKLIRPIFNSSSLGSYLIWNNAHKIFTDERKFIYPKHLIKEINLLDLKPEKFKDLIRRYNFKIAIIDHRLSNMLNLLKWLTYNMDWHLIYCDHIAAIFLRSGYSDTIPIIEKYEIQDQADKNCKLLLHKKYLYQMIKAYLIMNMPNRALNILKQIEKKYKRQKDSIHLFLKGKAFFAKGDSSKAFELLKQAWELDKTNEQILNSLIELNLNLGEPQNLEEAYQWSKKIPRNASSSKLLLIQAKTLHLKGYYKEAREILYKILEKHPKYKNVINYITEINKQIDIEQLDYYLKGSKKLVQEKEYNKAVDLLQKALEINDQYADIYLRLGNIHLIQKNFQRAAQNFKAVLKLAPDHLEASCKLAVAIANLDEWSESYNILESFMKNFRDHYQLRQALFSVDKIAINKLRKQIRKNFSYSKIEQLCGILRRREQYLKAIKILEKFRNKISKGATKRYKIQLCKFYYEQGRHFIYQSHVSKGIEYLKKSIELDSDYFESYLLLGIIAMKKNEWDKAGHYFNILNKIAPLDERGRKGVDSVRFGKALQLQLSGQYLKALKEFKSYVKNSTKSRQSIKNWISNIKVKYLKKIFTSGLNAMKSGKWKTAVSYFDKVLKMEPQFAEALINRGQSYLNYKKLDRAKKDFIQALKFKKNLDHIHFNLGYIYYLQGQDTKAYKHFKSYLKIAPKGKKAFQVKTILKMISIK